MPSPFSTPAPPTSTSTQTPTATPSRTIAPPGNGPELTHLGLARADSTPLAPVGVDEKGRPIYFSLIPQGMTLIVEARPGLTGRPPGSNGFNAGGSPDLQVIASRPLGNGSALVCDIQPPDIGGIPGTDPLEFDDTPVAVAAFNDFGYRVNDGTGQPLARLSSMDACTTANSSSSTGFGFVGESSTIQFCLPIARAWAFPIGDTVVAARVRDIDGALGPASEILVRVGESPEPTPSCEGDERAMTIARPASMLLNSYLGSTDVGSDPWQEGPIRVCLGPEGTDGRRSLELSQDVTLALGVVDGSLLCVHLEALGSHGTIDCAGGSAHDVLIAQDSHGPGIADEPVLESGLGSDAGPGAATLTSMVVLRLFPPGSPPERCDRVGDRSGITTALTTATATARVINASQGGTVEIATHGTNFDCSRLTDTDSPGALVLPFPAVETVVGDTANVLLLAD